MYDFDRTNTGGYQLSAAARWVSMAACLLGSTALNHPARAVDVSQPAMLQMFEAKWDTMEDRMADIFQVGYGQLWLPPPQRADSGGLSVGYDVFDRFDLGKPRNETLYGTENGLKANIAAAHNAGMKVYTDFIPNHNGFGNGNDAGFAAAGGYPGFVFSAPGKTYGDYHNPSISYQTDGINGSLFGLIDIAQEENIQLIRHPIAAGNPDNIPAGTIYNKPDPNNARFYADQGLGGVQFTDPALGTTFTRYSYNLNNPLAGDPVAENATGLLMRNMQYMIQAIGVDGFRVDAARHFPNWVMNYLDNATFRASLQTNFDGSIKPIYMFSEIADGDKGLVQSYIRRDIPNKFGISASDTTVDGNRDALDFPLFYALRSNLSDNGTANNWHNIRGASMDVNDDGLQNGSQGVMFVDSHDEQNGFFPYLKNVAYAYTLMLPGNTMVYLNAKEFGTNRAFPHDVGGTADPMSNDALGGFYGDSVARLVDIRNSHGRGNFQERWVDNLGAPGAFSNIYVYERLNSALVGLNSRLDAGFDERTVQTGFAPNSVLVELTGNATDAAVDPNNDIRDTVRVNGSGQATIRIPRNSTHGQGYVVYGVAPPQGSLALSNVASVLEGGVPALATNGTTRLADIDVITANSFKVTLNTTPVTLAAPVGEATPYRDFEADGDQAVLKIDGGMNLNNLPGIDRTNPADVSYAFEDFTEVRTPGYIDNGSGVNIGTGAGLYEQTIDTTQLSEGRHYITARAYRRRSVVGTPVYTDFKKVIYVDRLPSETAVASFDPFATSPGTLQDRDLIVRSVDGTADSMHVFLDLPPNLTEAQILALVNGSNAASYYDRDAFIRGFSGIRTGNHVATIVAFEPTGNKSFKRVAGMFTNTGVGAGFGDMNGNGVYQGIDIRNFSSSFEAVLYSQGNLFNAAADIDGDGVVTNLDLFALEGVLAAAPANSGAIQVMSAYDQLLLHRADLNQDGQTNAADVAYLYAGFDAPDQAGDWLRDLNVDGLVNKLDVEAMITELVRTSYADFNLDRRVDGADFLVWQSGLGVTGARFDQGDATLNGTVASDDYALWTADLGFIGPNASAAAASGVVPEPSTALLGMLSYASLMHGRSRGAMRKPRLFTFGERCGDAPQRQATL